MKKRWKERTVCIMAVLAMLISSVCPAAETESDTAADTEEVFSLWNEDAPALSALTDYVEAVTEEGSESYIPVEDRIAVFDMGLRLLVSRLDCSHITQPQGLSCFGVGKDNQLT